MPVLLLRQLSTTSLAAIVEKSQRQPNQGQLDYDLQLKNNQLDLILLSRPPEPSQSAVKTPTDLPKLPVLSKLSPDEGFESDIDTISIVSSENESFAVDKVGQKPVLAETDSANGGSGTESETETEKTNTLTPKNANTLKEGLDKQLSAPKEKETFDLVDCVCYSDVTYPDVLIFVIRNEALVFKFANIQHLQTFYTNFTTLKAVTNQKAYNLTKNIATKYNLLQRTDQNGVTHIEIKKQNGANKSQNSTNSGPSSIISIDTPDGTISKKFYDFDDSKSNKLKDINLRQRAESKLITDMRLLNDVKFNTINNKVGTKKMMVRSSSIENILNIDSKESNLVKDDGLGTLRKVWNSAEDLLDSDCPRRPERRRKKKPAPPPPATKSDRIEDVLSGQFVRVNVNLDKDFVDKNRLVVKSNANEPHPKKLGQNFNLLSGKTTFASFLKSKIEPKNGGQILRYPQENATLNRSTRTPLYEKNSSWTNSVPRILKKSSRSKSETRNTQQNFQPMAYRYIDTTMEYPYNTSLQNNAIFLTATGLKPKPHSAETLQRKHHNLETQPRLAYAYNVPNLHKQQENTIGNRIFGLTPKLKDFSRGDANRLGNKWGSASDLTFLSNERDRNNLKSSIKSGEGGSKKKNEKKVTFSAYTTVQVV
ncbi:uncharacterized protein LOC143193137 [Rhynchophorus ferrugineus]|uniref:uncharacterized protein LOC143193137 n=1 Tax=Rhynchophorus ferrugineus TaxID=354439 RepID=UPI003FCDA214